MPAPGWQPWRPRCAEGGEGAQVSALCACAASQVRPAPSRASTSWSGSRRPPLARAPTGH